MKSTILFLAALLLLTTTNAQEQTGQVREQNSGKKTIPGVQIIFEDAVPTTSDDNGLFRLLFEGRKAGDLIFMQEIRKKGYELVNEKDFEIIKISSTTELGIDIILAKTGVIDTAKKDYYDVSDSTLIAGFKQEKRDLRSQLQAAQFDQQSYEDQLTLLQEQYDRQKQSLDNLASRFARVNFDDVTPIYKEALELFKSGKINEAIVKLESTNPTEQTRKIIAEEKRLTEAQADLDKQKAELAAQKKEQIAAVRLLADMYNVNFDPQKAEAQYDQLLLLDSTNLEILTEAADFYREQHRYKKASDTYAKIIEHPEAESWRVANAHGFLGNLYTTTGDLSNALMSYEAYFETYRKLYTADSSSFYKNSLAVSYERLGSTYASLGNLDTALFFYQERSELGEELYASYPDNEAFKNGLAFSYEKLGEIHTALGNLNKALRFYKQGLVLMKELHLYYPNNVEFKNDLARSFSKLGETHAVLGDLNKALRFYEQFNKLEQALYASFPDNVGFKNGLAISYTKLGETHASLGDLDKALFFYEQYNKLKKELYSSYPQNVAFKSGLAISYSRLGSSHTSLGNLDIALRFYEDATILFEELYTSYPKNVFLKNGLGVLYEKLGETHTAQENLDEALRFYEKDLVLMKELYVSYPDNVEFKNGLAISYQYIGITHASLGDLDKALRLYKQVNELEKELYASFPNNVEFKNGLAASYYKLGEINQKMNKIEVCKRYFKKAEVIWLELVEAAPEYVQFQQFLEGVRNEIKTLEDTSIFKINQQISTETDPLKLYQLYGTLSDTLRAKVKIDAVYKADLAQSLNSYARSGFFLREFEQVEADIREGMALGTDNKYLTTNLAPALLLQGKYEEALTAYEKYKDQPFGEQNLSTYRNAFLDDLRAFEEAGIIPKERMGDVAKIRAFLKK